MAGNTLGSRRSYQYTSDTGEDYCIVTDEDLGSAAGLTLSTAYPNLPRRFRPRIVYCEATISGKKVRKALVCQATSNLYADTSKSVTIDGTAFTTKGRRGERFSWVTNPTP